jgi:hypothetical protein
LLLLLPRSALTRIALRWRYFTSLGNWPSRLHQHLLLRVTPYHRLHRALPSTSLDDDNMDTPEEDFQPAPVHYAPQADQESNHASPMGGGGASRYKVRAFPPPINNNSSSVQSNTPSDEYTVARNSPRDHPSAGSDRTAPSPVILCISPAQDGGSFGFIHLSSSEIINQAAIIAYFDSAGREVVVLPCPDFEGFLVANLLRTRNVSFICNLPDYILTLGRQILEDNAFSNSNGCPDLSWLPQ